MRFLLDAHVPRFVAAALLQQGHDVASTKDILPDADDGPILQLAVREQRILITWDRDFGERVFLRGERPPPAIIYFRLEPPDFDLILPKLMPLLDFGELSGHMTIIDPDRTRRRVFQNKSSNNG